MPDHHDHDHHKTHGHDDINKASYRDGHKIPDFKQWLRDKIRNFRMKDIPELNTLLGEREFDDDDIDNAIESALDDINFTPPPLKWRLEDFPSLNILELGATIELLQVGATLRARNELPYSEPNGISVNDNAKTALYESLIDRLRPLYEEKKKKFKVSENLSRAYGGVSSEYMIINRYRREIGQYRLV